MPKALRAQPSSAARLSRSERDYALGTWSDVFVIIWRRGTPLSAVLQLRKECERFGQLHPEGVLLLTIIEEKAPPPEPPSRAGIAAFLKSANYIRASAVVLEGHSFRAALVRGVVTGLTLLARQPFPHQICSIEGAAELFERTRLAGRQSFARAEFLAAIAELRALLEPTPAE